MVKVWLLVVIVTSDSVSAQADGVAFAELAAGASVPMATDLWDDYVDVGPSFSIRAGMFGAVLGEGTRIGGSASFDVALLAANLLPGLGSPPLTITTRRYRLQLAVEMLQQVAGGIHASLRAGGGIEVFDTTVVGFVSDGDRDGLPTFELAGGLWFATAGPLHLGGLAGLVATRRDTPIYNDAELDPYTCIDVQVLLGLRLMQH